MLPKAARMESFEDDRNDSSASTNTVPHIIVACPSCSTKFAVESSLVAAVEDPQFHCSRCDQVFSLEEVSTVLHRDLSGQGLPRDEEVALSGAIASSDDVSSTESDKDYSESTGPKLSQRGMSSPSAPAPYNPPSQAHSTTSSALGSTNSIPAPIRASDFSVSTSSASNLVTTPERASITSFETSSYKPPSHRDEVSSEDTPTYTSAPQASPTNTGWVILPDELAPRITTNKTEDALHPHTPPQTSVEAVSAQSAAQAPAPNLPPAVKPNLIKASAPTSQSTIKGVQQELQFNRANHVAELTRMQSLALAAAPLLVVLAALFIGSYSIRLSPDTLGAAITKVTNLFGGVSPILPPVELTVSKVSFKGVRIATKELVPVVTGVLTNRSQFTADGVTLEALGFDGRGELLISAQAPLRSALGREKLSELSLDTLKKFQSSLGARSAHIKPGEEVPFTIALIPDGSREDQPSLADINLSQLKYFSARVFAVTSTTAE